MNQYQDVQTPEGPHAFLLKNVVMGAISKEDLSEKLHMGWRELVELIDQKGLMHDPNLQIKLLSLQSERIF